MSNEKKRKVFVHQKLKQYSKRNIQKTEELRQASAEILPSQISSPTSSMSTSFFGKQTSKTIPEKKKRLADVYAYTERTDKEKDKNVQKTWLMHRVKEAEEHLETLEMNDVLSSWSSNRARIQEEIFRRHESSQYSAQTGSRILNVIKSNELTAEKNRRLKSLHLKRRIVNNFLDSSSDEDSTIDNSGGDEEGFEVKNERMIDVSHEGIQTTGIDELPVFLSPYNNLKEVGPVKIQSSMYLEDVVQEPTAVLKGFLSPTTHANIPKKSKQRVLLMDIIQNNTLSRSNSMNNLQKADSKFSQGLDHPIGPSSTSSTRKVHKSKRNSLIPTSPSAARGKGISASKISSLTGPAIVPDIPEITKPSFGRYLDKGKVVMHNVYELYANQVVKHNEVVIKNMKPNRNGVPTTQGSTKTIQRPPSPKSPSSSRPVSSRTRGNISNRLGSSHPSLPEPKEPIFQTLSDFGHPPSLLYGAQMDECERIKLELSKRKIHIPSKVLERSIVVPEDKPFSVCKRDLPSPSAGLIEDVSLLPARRRRPRSGRSTRTPRSTSGSRPNTGRPNSSRLPSSRASTAR